MSRQGPRGFSLLEVLIATAILALVFAYVSGAFIQGGMLLSKTPRLTQAALLLRGVVLDLEEEYQKEGFPENDVTSRRCELPREAGEGFECEYDLEKLDLDASQLGEMAASVLESILAGVGEKGSLLQAFQVLAFLFVVGEIPIAPLCPATPSQFMSMCNINLAAVESNILGMVQFFPTIISQAAEQTRKLRVRLKHRSFGQDPVLHIETFIISVPEEVQKLEQEGVIPQGGAPGIPGVGPGGVPPGVGVPGGGLPGVGAPAGGGIR